MSVPDGLVEASRDAMVGFMTGNSDLSSDAMAFIIQRGPGAINGALHVWSAMTVRAAKKMSAGSPWTVDLVFDDSEAIDPEEFAAIDRARGDAVRMVEMYERQDWNSIMMMTQTYWNEGVDSTMNLMISSASLAAGASRRLATPSEES